MLRLVSEWRGNNVYMLHFTTVDGLAFTDPNDALVFVFPLPHNQQRLHPSNVSVALKLGLVVWFKVRVRCRFVVCVGTS